MSDRIYYSTEAERRAKRERTMIAALFLLIGAGIGAILALLFAPGQGEHIRERVSGVVDERIDRSRDATQATLDQLETKYSDLRDYVDDALSKIRN